MLQRTSVPIVTLLLITACQPIQAPAPSATEGAVPPVITAPAIIVLPDGSACRWAGEGATLAFDGKRLNYTCSDTPEPTLGLIGDVTQLADGQLTVEVATISHGTNGFALERNEVLTFPIPELLLADGDRCLWAGEGATLAFDGNRLNYTCESGPNGEVGILGGLALGEAGLISVQKAQLGRNDQGWVVESTLDQTVAEIRGATTANAEEDGAMQANELVGVVWQWQGTTMSDDTVYTPEQPERYTLEFLPAGEVQFLADCNRGRGRYEVADNQLTILPGPMTLMACPPDSLDTEFLQGLQEISSYFLQDGNLVLELKVDSGSMVFAPAAEAAGEPAAGVGSAAVTGVVTYRQRMALPPAAIIQVQLVDVSRADAPATVLAEQVIEAQGQQVPFAFTLPYDPAAIQPNFTYAVQARIEIDGELWFINTEHYRVLTNGAPGDIEVVVNPTR
jgi:uncharacterized lipoprotein YbaY